MSAVAASDKLRNAGNSALRGVLAEGLKFSRLAGHLKARSYKLLFAAPSAGTLTLRWRYSSKSLRSGGKRAGALTLIEVVSFRIPTAGHAGLMLKLDAKVRRAFARVGQGKRTLDATFAPSGGGRLTISGQTTTHA